MLARRTNCQNCAIWVGRAILARHIRLLRASETRSESNLLDPLRGGTGADKLAHGFGDPPGRLTVASCVGKWTIVILAIYTGFTAYQTCLTEPVAGSDRRAAPRLIVAMSLQLIISRRAALQQSSLLLHQPRLILKEKRNFEKEKLLNCMCTNSKLSQQKGSVQGKQEHPSDHLPFLRTRHLLYTEGVGAPKPLHDGTDCKSCSR